MFVKTINHNTDKLTRGFSLVEVSLAIAVVAIGLIGILVVFPLGVDATRLSKNLTQIATIGQYEIAYWQQEALDFDLYTNNPNVIVPNSMSYSGNVTVNGISYWKNVVVVNSDYPQISTVGLPITNMITRVYISIWQDRKSTRLNSSH